MHDDRPFRIAGPTGILHHTVRRLSDGMQTLDELSAVSVLRQRLYDLLPHPGHDPHGGDDVSRIGELYADLRERRTDGTHREGNGVHRSAAHAAREALRDDAVHLRRRHPVAQLAFHPRRRGGNRRATVGRRDERARFDASRVLRVRQSQPTRSK